MFRLFRAPQLITRLPFKSLIGRQPPHVWQHTSPPIDNDLLAKSLIEEAKRAYRDNNLNATLASLDKLTNLSDYSAFAFLEKGKTYLLQGDLIAARQSLGRAISINPDITEAKRLYLQISYAIGGVPKFLEKSIISPLSSFSETRTTIKCIHVDDEEPIKFKPN